MYTVQYKGNLKSYEYSKNVSGEEKNVKKFKGNLYFFKLFSYKSKVKKLFLSFLVLVGLTSLKICTYSIKNCIR